MLEALCRQSSTTLDIVHAEDGPPITQRTSGLVRIHSVVRRASEGIRRILHGVPAVWPIAGGLWASLCIIASMPVI